MAKKDRLPNFNEKRKMLHTKVPPPETLSEVGRRFLEAGQLYDALDFFHKAGDQDGMNQVRMKAVEEADPVLLKLAAKRSEKGASADEWRSLGENAMKMGKKRSAEEAFGMAGDWKAVARLRGEVIDDDLPPIVEEPEGEEEDEEDDGDDG